MLLVKFRALSLTEYGESHLNGARAWAFRIKGHLSVGADADISILDIEAKKLLPRLWNGRVSMLNGNLVPGTTSICDEEEQEL